MDYRINLFRGFVVNKINEVCAKGFTISNPKWHFMGESNWPGGLSFGRMDAFGLAQQIAEEHQGIPVGGRITINEYLLQELPLIGIKRILNANEGMSPGSIDSWRCLSWEDVQKAWEFTISPKYLTSKWLNRLEAAVSTKSGVYMPFDEFRISIEGKRSFFEGLFR